MKIRAVIFDVGNTLVDYRADCPSWAALDRITLGEAAIVAGLPPDALAEAFSQTLHRRWSEARDGRINLTTRALFLDSLAAIGATLDDVALDRLDAHYCEAVRRYRRADPDAAPVLQALKARGLRTAALSNTAWIDGLLRRDLDEVGLGEWLDCVAASAEIGHWKPQPAAFHWVTERLGVRPGEAIYVGDRLIDDVGGAQRAGLRGVLRRVVADDQDYEAGARLGITPDATVDRLADVLSIVDAW